MKSLLKLLLLVSVACTLSILIFYNVDKAKPIVIEDDLVTSQNKMAKDYVISSNDTFENPKVIVNPYKISPLTALVMFETTDMNAVTITVNGKDSNTSFTHKFDSAKKHYIPVYGLYSNMDNKVTLTLNNGKTKELIIKTGSLPEDFKTDVNIVTSKKEALGNELYFVTPASSGYVAGYDVNGDVRWYLNETFSWDIKLLDNGNLMLSTNRVINPPYYTTGLMEMDFLGKIYYEYSLPGGYHHDVIELPSGNLLVASDDFDSGYVEDYIVEIDRETGNIIKEIDLKDILRIEDGKSVNWVEYDWFHNNSVWYDDSTSSITLSGRHQDAVINIDYETGKLNWIIGDSTNWSSEYQKYFFKPTNNLEWQYSQHAAMILPDGNVFIFDNGNNRSKTVEEFVKANDNYSRGVIYDINTNDMTIKQVWQYGKERGSSFYSPYISDVDYLSVNHYLIHSGGIVYKDGVVQNKPAGLTGADKLNSITVEVLNDEVIFEMQLPSNYYRAEKMNLYGNNDFSLDNGVRLGTLGKTKVDHRFLPIIFLPKSPDKKYDSYDINITKETDRLAISGTFKKEDKVEIILDNLFDKLVYDVRISSKPYTAMCLDIFNKDDLRVTKYINDYGIKGKYYIYIKINGTIYDLDLYVNY